MSAALSELFAKTFAAGTVTQDREPHDDIDLTYGGLGAYVSAHAIGVEGPVRESYLVDPRTPPVGRHTEIG